MESVVSNNKASFQVSAEHPTSVNEELRNLLLSRTEYVQMGEMGSLVSNEADTLLGTLCVLSCIAVFAWSRGRAFCAHVTLGNVLGGALLHRSGGDPTLHELASALKLFARSGEPVKIHLVGGFAAIDQEPSIGLYYGEDHSSFSAMVKSTVCAAVPRAVVDTRLMLRFKGSRMIHQSDEERLVRQGQRFNIAAIHLASGLLVTQTNPRFSFCLERFIPPTVLRKNTQTLSDIELMRGRRLRVRAEGAQACASAECPRVTLPVLRCSRCRHVYYCGARCQRRHYAKHKLVCVQSSPKQHQLQ